MKKLSIARRLYLGLALIILVGLASTVAALFGLSRISSQWENFEKSSLARLDLVSEANVELGRAVQEFKNLVLRSADYEPKALQHLTNIHQSVVRYEAMAVQDEERKYLDAIKTSTDAYIHAVQQAGELKRAETPIQDIDKAVAGAGRPIAEGIDRLKKLVLADVDAAGAIIHSTLNRNEQVLLVSLLIIVCFGTLLGYTLVRSIKSGLAAANASIDAVAGGDFSKAIDLNRHDEIGQLLRRASDMTHVLKGFLAAQSKLAHQHNHNGQISETIAEGEFPGAYGDMARNLNAMVKGHIEVQTRFTELMVEYANGRFDSRLPPLAGERKAISDAAEKVRAGLEASAKAAQYNARVKAALDHVSIPVRIADNEGQILYINNALKETLRKYEAAFRRQISGFDPDKVVGASVGMFYADPKTAVAKLSGIARATPSRMSLGGRDCDVVACPVFSEKGERLGTASQWNDITEQLAAEKEVAAIVEAAAAGDFTKRIAEAGKAGFMLQMAQGLNAVLGTTESALGEISRILKALAQGDLSQEISTDFKGVFAELKDNSNETIAKLCDIIAQIREASASINTAAREIATGNNDLSRRTEEQATSLEETASSIVELASTVKLNAENAQQANRLASEASEGAQRGGEVVTQVVATMNGITESNREIADITTIIDGIAFQTNLLALNAAVEAARAGEQGRGFGVVASEVRSLAQRASDAAKDIKAVIANSIGKVDEGARLVKSAGNAMDEIVAQVQRVSAIIGEIAAASKEQSHGVQQVNVAVTQIDQITQQNAALVEEATAAARSLEDQSEALVSAVAIFKLPHERGGSAGRDVARLPDAVGPTAGKSNGKSLH
jgi:methyl-accepting chemotaxis protein